MFNSKDRLTHGPGCKTAPATCRADKILLLFENLNTKQHFSKGNSFIQVFEHGKPISLPVQTAYRHYTTAQGRSLHSWNEWLKLPIRFSHLPRNAVAVFTVWDTHGSGKKAVGGTTIPLFGKYGTFKKVVYFLLLFLSQIYFPVPPKIKFYLKFYYIAPKSLELNLINFKILLKPKTS